MAINFPASPTLNQTFSSGNVNYVWDGTKWTASVTGGISLDKIEKGNTKAEVVDTGSDGRFVVTTEGSERLRVNKDGGLLIGTSTADVYYNVYSPSTPSTPGLQLKGAYPSAGLALNTLDDGSIICLANGANSNASNRLLGAISFNGSTGTYLVGGAGILAYADAATGPNNMPARLVFNTTPSGTSTPIERMRIQSNGRVLIGKTTDGDQEGFSTGTYTYQVSNDTVCAYFNRLTSDGVLIQFRQDTIDEGSISVSGTTVSYNGAHLSRWSQLPSGADRTEILRGSLLSNLEEMCEWGDEDNEQLNRMKVSDVEGDKNVAGVFQAWDDDDDTYTNDFYCAMTGDFIIRIGSGVTVERGDLLMSAGDGTAKPQDDDIVRSKTVAKVTSTSVTCTYDDGSYCVPCVLMAC